jgi:hypothetical protein
MTLKNESNFILLGDGKMKRKLMLLVAAMAVILTAVSANASYVIVAENFGGDGTGDLDATAADTFYSGITAAGGSATWAANSGFDDNGYVSAARKAAYLNMGSYINDTKGTADGLFELTMTISETTGSWISLGFGVQNTPSTDRDMTGGTNVSPQPTLATTGLGTIVYRDALNELDMFGGPAAGGVVDGPDNNTGARTLTVTLDLTPAGGTYGKVTWSDSVLGTLGSYTYTAAQNFGSILISASGATNTSGTIDDLTLSQSIPEPATIGLLLLGSVMGLRRRR